jgi:hypothetical protein
VRQARSQGFDARGEGNLARILVLSEDGGDNLLVFFGFEGTGGIDDTAAEANRAKRSGENRALAVGVARQIFLTQAMADFGVAAQSTGAAAGNVRQRKIKG